MTAFTPGDRVQVEASQYFGARAGALGTVQRVSSGLIEVRIDGDDGDTWPFFLNEITAASTSAPSKEK